MKIINTDKAPKAVGPYSQAVSAKGFIFTSGQIGINPDTGKITGTAIEEQTEQCLKNLKSVLNEAGADFTDVVETMIFITDLNYFGKVNAIYEKTMGNHKPARITVQAAGLPLNALIEIKMTAVNNS
jgi:2-iminobutanoate/2-iminopropanoate deaminase